MSYKIQSYQKQTLKKRKKKDRKRKRRGESEQKWRAGLRRVSVEASAISKHVRNREQTRREMAGREAINKLSHFILQCVCVCVHVAAVGIYVTVCVCLLNQISNQLVVSNSTRLMRQTVTLPENIHSCVLFFSFSVDSLKPLYHQGKHSISAKLTYVSAML